MKKALQFVEEFKTEKEAKEALDWQKIQDGYLGGRIIEPCGKGWWTLTEPPKTWKLQVFFKVENDKTEWYPDGVTPVILIDAQYAVLGIL